jgi:hypothetical protein
MITAAYHSAALGTEVALEPTLVHVPREAGAAIARGPWG